MNRTPARAFGVFGGKNRWIVKSYHGSAFLSTFSRVFSRIRMSLPVAAGHQNLERLIAWFNMRRSRITGGYIGDHKQVRRFRNSLKPRNPIDIHAVKKRGDIPGVVPGKVRETVYDVVGKGPCPAE
ncbi:MAG: hypothetical protein HY788_07825 [Deltaproteobacteria bacterium]|nr:hypothetical protein [Deltaproteobacteria bacterium]